MQDQDTDTRPISIPKHTGIAATLLTAAGLAAAFGVASCCALPLLLSGLGIGSAALAGIALFAEPHRALLLAAGAVCLVAGGIFLWRERRISAVCATGAVCSKPVVRGLTGVGLVLGLILLVLGYVFV